MGLLIVWGVYTLTFFAVNLAPGDPFQNLENPKMTREDIERLRARWGYDRPVIQRYFIHLGKLLWRRRETRTTESGGLEFLIVPRHGQNWIEARLQTPPDDVILQPTETSRDQGARTIRLERRPDGSYPSREIRPGRYAVGRTYLIVGERASRLETDGITLRAEDGRIHVAPTLTSPPAEVVLERKGAPGLALPATGDGRFGPVRGTPGTYRLGEVDVLIPEEPLAESGPTLDLGTSILNKEPVVSYLASPLLNTLLLTVAAIFLDFLLGIVIGVLSAIRQNTRLDHAITVGALFIYSMPGFWLALMLVLLFAVKLRWLPAEGMHDVGETGLLDLLEHMILPTFVLGIGAAAATARYQRSSLLEVLGQDYIRTARAKGLDENTVIWKHAMRNALIPIITLFGLSLPFLVSGAVIVETIFSWPGMGSEAIKAIRGRDVFVVSGITLIGTTMVILGNLLADVLYAVVDPRVRLE